MKAKKYCILVVLFTVFFNGCQKKTEEEKKEGNEKYQQIRKEVLELCSQHDAIIDWYRNLGLKDTLFEALYSVKIQDVFLNQNKRPYLFIVQIPDIKKVNGKYLLIADQIYPLEATQGILIHLRLFCDEVTVEKIFERRPSYVDEYALIATIKSIEKPYSSLSLTEYDTDTYNDDRPHPDERVGWMYDNSFIATGQCEDLVFLWGGEDDWLCDYGGYKRFYEIFDVNTQPEKKKPTFEELVKPNK